MSGPHKRGQVTVMPSLVSLLHTVDWIQLANEREALTEVWEDLPLHHPAGPALHKLLQLLDAIAQDRSEHGTMPEPVIESTTHPTLHRTVGEFYEPG